MDWNSWMYKNRTQMGSFEDFSEEKLHETGLKG